MLGGMSDQQPAQGPHQVPPYASSSPGAYPQPASQQPAPQRPGARQPAPQGYVLNGQGAHPAPSASTTGNPAGRAGLVIGLISIVAGIATNLLVQVMIHTDGYAIVSFVSGIGSLLAFATGVAALILGLIGIRRPGAPHAAAGIATGIGIATVVTILFNQLISVVATVLYV